MRTPLRYLALPLLAAGVFLLAWYWPHVRNEFFVLIGNRNETGGWYGFNSGVAGAAYITIGPALLLWYWHHTCQEKPACLRWGKYEVAGGLGKKCARHHPDLRNHPRERHGQILDRLHEEWKSRVTAQGARSQPAGPGRRRRQDPGASGERMHQEPEQVRCENSAAEITDAQEKPREEAP